MTIIAPIFVWVSQRVDPSTPARHARATEAHGGPSRCVAREQVAVVLLHQLRLSLNSRARTRAARASVIER